MISENDIIILSHLRKNARKRVTEISREMNIPVTTLYDRIRAHEKSGIVKRHVSLLDYRKLGYSTQMMLAFSTARDKREALKDYLINHPNVNSLYRLDLGHDFLAETVFEDYSRFQEFIDTLEADYGMTNLHAFNMCMELKREGFLANDKNQIQ